MLIYAFDEFLIDFFVGVQPDVEFGRLLRTDRLTGFPDWVLQYFKVVSVWRDLFKDHAYDEFPIAFYPNYLESSDDEVLVYLVEDDYYVDPYFLGVRDQQVVIAVPTNQEVDPFSIEPDETEWCVGDLILEPLSLAPIDTLVATLFGCLAHFGQPIADVKVDTRQEFFSGTDITGDSVVVNVESDSSLIIRNFNLLWRVGQSSAERWTPTSL